MELVLGLPKTEKGYDAIVAIACQLTKNAHFVPTRQMATTEGLRRIITKDTARLHGVPKAIVTDSDTRLLRNCRRFRAKS